MDMVGKVQVIDSHTGGEPTRVVTGGIPDLGGGSVTDRAAVFARDFDGWRMGVVTEPRGSDILVGALLVEASDPAADLGVIFFNNVGVLGMCGHGTIGLVETLRHLGKSVEGELTIETRVGLVKAGVREDGWVWVQNVPSYRWQSGVSVDVAGHGTVTGDVAYGGNWFFLCGDHGLPLGYGDVEELTAFSWAVREGIERQGISGEAGGMIDHIELFGPAQGEADSRNFVLCPGKAYDRSPCGTGTSAKVACLAADGILAPGQVWRQESVTGSIFEAEYQALGGGGVLPTISGQAWITGDATLWFDPTDPLRDGIGG